MWRMREHLGRAGWIDAAGGGFPRLSHQVRPALRAFLRHMPRPAGFRPLLFEDPNDFGNHVAGALDDDVVLRSHVLAGDLVFVVQRRTTHRHTGNLRGPKPRHGCRRTGAPDVDLDVLDDGLGLLGRELERQRPARTPGDEPQLCLLPQVVDLDDNAVDLVVETVALLLPFVEEGDHGLDVGVRPAIVVDMKAHLGESLEDLLLALRAARRIERVDERVEAPARRDPRVELPNGARGRVARVREGRLALRGQLGVQSLEAALRHVDLAPHLECLGELHWDDDRQGDTADRLHGRGDVCTRLAVAGAGADLVAALV